MLPPDTSSSLLPWRVVVPMMQVYGSFPYRMSPTDGPPVFSLLLCLWNVLKQLMVLAVFSSGIKATTSSFVTMDVGSFAYMSTILSAITIVWLAPITMAARSNILAALLHDMSAFKDVCPPPTHRWYCRAKTQAFLVLVVVCVTFTIRACYAMMGVLGVVLITPLCSLFGMGFVVPVELSSMVFGVLGRRLLVSTEATVAAVSTLLSSDRSFKCESDVEEATEALCDLEAVIREVWRKGVA